MLRVTPASARSDRFVVLPSVLVVSDCNVRKKVAQIAIIDDDEHVREAIRGLMRATGFSAETFSSAIEFLRSPQMGRTTCLIADVNMPEMSGLDMYFRLLELGKAVPTILITAYPSDNDRSRALDAGVIRYLAKPFVDADLLDGVTDALARPSRNDDSKR
jgi:FixJ family two-component response regulator